MMNPVVSVHSMVYVVDDDLAVRTALRRLLERSDRTVVTCESLNHLLIKIATTAASSEDGCLVIDVHLGELNSINLVGSIRKAGYEHPIIFITGDSDVHAGVAAMKLGATDYLIKPVEADVMLTAVDRAMMTSHTAQRERQERQDLEARFSRLTEREQQVFGLVVTGLLNKQIASRLGICEKTVKVHRGRVMEKMEVQSLARLVHVAERLESAMERGMHS